MVAGLAIGWQRGVMEIDGYALGALVRMSAAGPLWEGKGPTGDPVLVSVRPASWGEASEERWQAWAGLDSDHVVELIDVARHQDGRWALIMEWVPGESLEALLARGFPRTLTERERVREDVRRGLDDLHAAGLVHGDVAPANVIVRPDGHAVLIDVADGPGGILGTPGWSMADSGVAMTDDEAFERLSHVLENAVLPDEGRSGSGVTEVLRRVALSDVTRCADSPARHRARSARRAGRWGWAVGAIVVVCVGVVASVVRGGASVAGGAEEIPAPGDATVVCPGEEAARGMLADLVDRRDGAIEDRDDASIAKVMSGDVGSGDVDLVHRLVEEDVRVEGLHTEIGDIENVTCRGGMVSLSTTVRQLAHRRCDASRCAEIGDQAVHRVRVTLTGEPRLIGEVEESE